MKLKIVLPHRVLVETEVEQVTADGLDGSFGLLPRHIDFVSVLPPGVLSYRETGAGEWFVAVDEGVLIKQGDRVQVATRNAAKSRHLEELKATLEEDLLDWDEREQKSRSKLAMMEAAVVRQVNERIQGQLADDYGS